MQICVFILFLESRCPVRWKEGKDGFQKWSQFECDQISSLLLNTNKTMPTEIHRSVRGLEHIKRWKGVEFRTFLLYIGIVVLKNFLSIDIYEHFLTLSCAVTICSSVVYKKYIPIATDMFQEYAEHYKEFYGEGTISSNIHNLIHVTGDVMRFGNLNQNSTYMFENCLRHMKLSIQQCNKPLEQIVRRVAEESCLPNTTWRENAEKNLVTDVKYPFKISPESNQIAHNQITLRDKIIFSNRKEGDKFFLTFGNEIVEMDYVIEIDGQLYIYGYPIVNKESFFSRPFDSKRLNIYGSNCEKTSPKYKSLSNIKCKMIPLCQGTGYIFLPLIHSLDLLNP